MKTFVMAAVAATVTAGAALAHPVNEPHICGIDPSTVMDWPASNWVSENTGQIYDKGAYFFIATNDNDGSGEYTTTHTRIWKDDCRVTGVDIFHANDEPVMEVELTEVEVERVPNAGHEIDRDKYPYGRVVASRSDMTLSFINRGKTKTVTVDEKYTWRQIKDFSKDANSQLRDAEKEDVRTGRQIIKDEMDRFADGTFDDKS